MAQSCIKFGGDEIITLTIFLLNDIHSALQNKMSSKEHINSVAVRAHVLVIILFVLQIQQ